MTRSISAAARKHLRVLLEGWCEEHLDAGTIEEAESIAEEVRRMAASCVFEAAAAKMSGKPTYRGSSVGCSCGARARFVSYRSRFVRSAYGEARVERAYYHCRSCGGGQAPWDGEQGLNERVCTAGLKATACQVVGRLSYHEGVNLLSALGVVQMEESSAEEIAAEVGVRLRQRETEQIAAAQRDAEEALAQKLWCKEDRAERGLVAERAVEGDRLYVAMDAGKAHIDREWRDVKVGTVFTVSPDGSGLDRLSNRAYVAAPEACEPFGWRLRAQALRWNQPGYEQTVFLADGADYNWSLCAFHFPQAVQILDFFHAAEHIYTLARTLYKLDDASDWARGERWAKERIASLRDDGPQPLLRALRRRRASTKDAQETLRREIGYFQKNQERMQYPIYRRAGMMIGSGPVEAACKVVVGQRMKQAGMRWSTKGASHVLAIRTALLNGEQDRLRRAAKAA